VRLNNPDYQKKAAFTIYKGILDYLNADWHRFSMPSSQIQCFRHT
jgi:hypothetical protein